MHHVCHFVMMNIYTTTFSFVVVVVVCCVQCTLNFEIIIICSFFLWHFFFGAQGPLHESKLKKKKKRDLYQAEMSKPFALFCSGLPSVWDPSKRPWGVLQHWPLHWLRQSGPFPDWYHARVWSGQYMQHAMVLESNFTWMYFVAYMHLPILFSPVLAPEIQWREVFFFFKHPHTCSKIDHSQNHFGVVCFIAVVCSCIISVCIKSHEEN